MASNTDKAGREQVIKPGAGAGFVERRFLLINYNAYNIIYFDEKQAVFE